MKKFVHYILSNMFRPLLRPSSGWYYYKNTKVQMWLADGDTANHICAFALL